MKTKLAQNVVAHVQLMYSKHHRRHIKFAVKRTRPADEYSIQDNILANRCMESCELYHRAESAWQMHTVQIPVPWVIAIRGLSTYNVQVHQHTIARQLNFQKRTARASLSHILYACKMKLYSS